jgi:hypothetical protein
MDPQQLTQIPYHSLEQDFYQVARKGLDAEVTWCNGKMGSMQQILLKYAIPVARQGLINLGIEQVDQWIDIIQQRTTTGQTGAKWILAHWGKNSDTSTLVQQYLQHARKNIPVHLWPVP